MLPSIGVAEVAIIAGVVVILFGAKRIPEAARNLGKSLSEFKRGLKDGEDKGGKDSSSSDSQPK